MTDIEKKDIQFDKQSQCIARCQQRLLNNWESGWNNMIKQWLTTERDAMWLMYSANYLMQTNGVKWAVDPVTLRNKIADAPPVDVSALSELSFILLTHADSDHIDMELISQLRGMPIHWVVPHHMTEVPLEAGVPACRIITAKPMNPISFGGVTVTPFDGMHWQYDTAWGIGKPVAGTHSTGYLVEWKRHRILLPGDTRTYDTGVLPRFGPVDTLVAHVWLGRNAALQKEPPLLQAMGEFILDLQPRQRIILTHLWQVARRANAYWDKTHAECVREYVHNRLPNLDILVPAFWNQQDL